MGKGKPNMVRVFLSSFQDEQDDSPSQPQITQVGIGDAKRSPPKILFVALC